MSRGVSSVVHNLLERHVSHPGKFAPQGAFDNIWKHFWGHNSEEAVLLTSNGRGQGY